MIFAQTIGRPQDFALMEATLLKSEPYTVSVVHYKPSDDRDNHMLRHEAVEKYDDEKRRIGKMNFNYQTNLKATSSKI